MLLYKIIFVVENKTGLELSEFAKKNIADRVWKEIPKGIPAVIFQTYDGGMELALLVKRPNGLNEFELYNVTSTGDTTAVAKKTAAYVERYITSEGFLIIFIENRNFINVFANQLFSKELRNIPAMVVIP